MKTSNDHRLALWKGLAPLALAAFAFAASALPALARDSYVTDGAGLFSDSTVTSLNQQIADFQQQTGKEVVVDTVPSLNGQTLQDAAQQAFQQLHVDGVLIFMAKSERQDLVVGDRASRAIFPPGTFTSIHDAMRGYFRQGDFDGGIKTGVNLIIAQYRGHAQTGAGSASQSQSYPVTRNAPAPVTSTPSTRGSHMSFFWLLIILLAGFLIIRALFRAMSGPRMLPPGAGPGPAPGPGYGPGYGGYGYGGGGGGNFFSGLLGGLGGAWLGNELFNRGAGGGQTIVQDPGGANVGGGGWGGGSDASGFQSDAGQADMGNAGGGDRGSGGGFDAGGGGDFGGGGGFDSGGGGGDSGGGW